MKNIITIIFIIAKVPSVISYNAINNWFSRFKTSNDFLTFFYSVSPEKKKKSRFRFAFFRQFVKPKNTKYVLAEMFRNGKMARDWLLTRFISHLLKCI